MYIYSKCDRKFAQVKHRTVHRKAAINGETPSYLVSINSLALALLLCVVCE